MLVEFGTSLFEYSGAIPDVLKDAAQAQLYQDIEPRPGRPREILRVELDTQILWVADDHRRRAGLEKMTKADAARVLMEANPGITYDEALKRVGEVIRLHPELKLIAGKRYDRSRKKLPTYFR